MDEEDLEWLTGLGTEKRDLQLMMTLAPEQTRPGDIRCLVETGIIVCTGHSNATYEEMTASIDAGVSGFTHLFNAMGSLYAREPGVTGAALDSQETWCSIIVDGFHVHAACIRSAWRTKPAGKLFLISDAMATVGSTSKSFRLYGEKLKESNGRIVNGEGRLAGSAISLMDAIRQAPS